MANPSSAETLSSTAYWTASVRALETARDDRLIDDPWAAALAGGQGAAWIAQRPAPSVLPIVLRTRYFDDFLRRIVSQDGIRQVVLMAAGLDTRAYRLGFPADAICFEIDQPAILAYKEATLAGLHSQPTCRRRSVPANLTGPWREALLATGFDASVATGWLLEGFLFYLSSEAGERLLGAVTALSAPASWLGFDVVNAVTLTSPRTKPWIEMQAHSGAPWIGTMDDPAGFLAARGWQATLTQAGAPDANHGRWTWPVIPVAMPNMPHNWFVTAFKGHRPLPTAAESA
jgi:methyltransferase (TIGR00027 family)